MPIQAPRRQPAPAWKFRKPPAPVPAPPRATTGADVAIAAGAFLLAVLLWLLVDSVLPQAVKAVLPASVTALAGKPHSSVAMVRDLLPFALLAVTTATLAIFVVRLLRWAGIEDGSLEERIKKFFDEKKDRLGPKPPGHPPKAPAMRQLDARLLPASALGVATAATLVLTIKAPDKVVVPVEIRQPEAIQLGFKTVPDVVPITLAPGNATVPLTVAASLKEESLSLPVVVPPARAAVQVDVRTNQPEKVSMDLVPTVRQPVTVAMDVQAVAQQAAQLEARLQLLERSSMNLVRSMYAGKDDILRLQETAIARASGERMQVRCSEGYFGQLKELADDQLRREVQYLNAGLATPPEMNKDLLLAWIRTRCTDQAGPAPGSAPPAASGMLHTAAPEGQAATQQPAAGPKPAQ